MYKFIKLTIVFFFPILILLVTSELVLRVIPNDYSYKRNYLDRNSNNIEVLYLGSSHFYYGINPEYSTYKGFNAAHISQSLNYDIAILKKYKNKWSNLKCIIVPIDYFSMYFTLDDGIEKWRVKNYAIYFGINSCTNYRNRFELLSGKFSSNMLRLKSNYFNKISEVTCNKLGWGTSFTSSLSRDLIETGKTAAKRHTKEITRNVNFDKNIKILISLIDFANKKNIKVIFITCPAYKSYVENLEQKQLNNTIETITKLTSKNSNSVYYNFLNNNSFYKEDYFDADHLNEKGAKKLTLLVDSLIHKE